MNEAETDTNTADAIRRLEREENAAANKETEPNTPRTYNQ